MQYKDIEKEYLRRCKEELDMEPAVAKRCMDVFWGVVNYVMTKWPYQLKPVSVIIPKLGEFKADRASYPYKLRTLLEKSKTVEEWEVRKFMADQIAEPYGVEPEFFTRKFPEGLDPGTPRLHSVLARDQTLRVRGLLERG